jgi:hypothetical protein
MSSIQVSRRVGHHEGTKSTTANPSYLGYVLFFCRLAMIGDGIAVRH